MIPDLGTQLAALTRTTRRLKYSVAEEREQRVLELHEWIVTRGLNVTVRVVAEGREINAFTAREYLNDLVVQRKLYSWKIGATVWFGLRHDR